MAENVLRVVQLNIGSLIEPGWTERRHEVVAWLQRLQPDVACFEEVWEDARSPNTAAWIAEQFPALPHVQFGGAPFGAGLWPDPSLRFGSAVLSRWPIDDARHHLLPVGEEPDTVVANIPWELLQVRTAGLDVFACHLAPAPTHGLHRQRQVLAIDELVRAARRDLDAPPPFGQRRPAMPSILCGDFAWPQRPVE